ncbi:kinase-like domain-containing protein [Hyaloraphidium curvatum]|nr:kinase-like domain-containing protein [Hyaloraphidium curvatum]
MVAETGGALPREASGSSSPTSSAPSSDSAPRAPRSPRDNLPGKVDLDSRFHWGRLLGRGSYADVVLVHTLPPPDHPAGVPFAPVPYAMKIIDKRLIRSSHQLQELLREIRIMRRLTHPSVVKLVEVFETERKVYLQLEYVSGGELFDRIAERDHFSEREARDIIYQIVDALCYLHSQGVVHRDLKPENILTLPSQEAPPSPVPSSIVHDLPLTIPLDPLPATPSPPTIPLPVPHPASLTVKLADFGLATTLGFPPSSMPHPLKTQCGSFPYVAPEILVGSAERGYGYGVDVWSLGVVAFVLLSGHFPFRPEAYSSRDPAGHVDGDPHAPRPESTRRMLERIMEGGWRRAMAGEGWEGVSGEGREFVVRCLEVDPEKRWNAVQAKEAAWFRVKLEGDAGGEEPRPEGAWAKVVDRFGAVLGTGPRAHGAGGSPRSSRPGSHASSRAGAAPEAEQEPPAEASAERTPDSDRSGAPRPASPDLPMLPPTADPSLRKEPSHTTGQRINDWWHHLVHGDRPHSPGDDAAPAPGEEDGVPPVHHAGNHGNHPNPPPSIRTRKTTSRDLAPAGGAASPTSQQGRAANAWNPKHIVHRIRVHAWERRKVKEERMRDADEGGGGSEA